MRTPGQGVLDFDGGALSVAGEGIPPGQGVTGNVLSGSLSALLGTFGLADVQSQDDVSNVVQLELEARGHQARTMRLRFATLHLQADPQTAVLLRYDVQRLLDVLADKVPGVVERIVIHALAESAITKAEGSSG